MLDEADAYARANGLDLPEEPEARTLGPLPNCVTNPVLSLDLKREGITSVIWATRFQLDFGWIDLDIFREDGRPHQDGMTEIRASTSWGCPGCRAVARPSSGGDLGKMRSGWRG